MTTRKTILTGWNWRHKWTEKEVCIGEVFGNTDLNHQSHVDLVGHELNKQTQSRVTYSRNSSRSESAIVTPIHVIENQFSIEKKKPY